MTEIVQMRSVQDGPSGRDHPTIREGLSSQEGVEWSGSRAARRVPGGWRTGNEFPGDILGGSFFY